MSEHKFHVGQPVRVDCEHCGLKRNDVGTVELIGVMWRGGEYKELSHGHIKLEEQRWDGTFPPNELKPAYALEVGCKVVYGRRELIGVVTSVHDTYIMVDFLEANNQRIPTKDIYVLEPAPKKVKPQGVIACIDESSTFGGTAYEAIMKLMKDERLITCGTPVRGESVHGTITVKLADNIKIYGGNVMEIKGKYKKLAERMKDEFVGNGNGTIFLKKAGECSIERREIEFDITPEEIEALLNVRGITKALGTFEIETYREHYNIGIVKLTPISTKKSKKNEAD